jgi:tRNA threonylcarbamoyladenosine biosynthesis protein TsaB
VFPRLLFALDLPLIAVDTLKVLSQASISSGLIVPMIDARRMEVYSAILQQISNVKRCTSRNH